MFFLSTLHIPLTIQISMTYVYIIYFFAVKQFFFAVKQFAHKSRGEILRMFSKYVGVCDSNEANVLTILEGCSLEDMVVLL